MKSSECGCGTHAFNTMIDAFDRKVSLSSEEGFLDEDLGVLAPVEAPSFLYVSVEIRYDRWYHFVTKSCLKNLGAEPGRHLGPGLPWC